MLDSQDKQPIVSLCILIKRTNTHHIFMSITSYKRLHITGEGYSPKRKIGARLKTGISEVKAIQLKAAKKKAVVLFI